MPFIRPMFLARYLLPLLRINLRKESITCEFTVHSRQVNPIRTIHSLTIDLPSSDEECLMIRRLLRKSSRL